MPRIRNVKPDFFTDADVCEHPPLERLLFEGLWCFADRDGRLEDRPRELKVKLLPYDECDINAMLDNLARPKPGRQFGFIRRYVVGGKRYIQVEKLGAHQKFHPGEKPRGLPAPPENDATAVPETVKPGAATPQPPAGTPSSTVQPPAEESFAGGQQVASKPETETETDVSETDQKPLSTSQSTAPLALVVETPTAPKPADEVFAHWRDTLRPKAKFDGKRERAVKARLKAGYSVDDLKRAIDGCAKTPHNQGHNDRGEKYDDLALICRDAEHVDRFMANAGERLNAQHAPPGLFEFKPDVDPYAEDCQ